jgi:hypothetical protein
MIAGNLNCFRYVKSRLVEIDKDFDISSKQLIEMVRTGEYKSLINDDNIIKDGEYMDYDVVVWHTKTHLGILFKEEGFWYMYHYSRTHKRVLRELFTRDEERFTDVHRVR